MPCVIHETGESHVSFLSCERGVILNLSEVSPSRGYPEAGMSFGDSKAVFNQRAIVMGMDEAVFRSFDRDGINAMATFAFSRNYAPGASSDAPLVKVKKKIIGRDPTTLVMSVARRLFNESCAHVASDIKTQVEQTETATRRLAPAERADRWKIQQNKLSGISIRGQYMSREMHWWTSVALVTNLTGLFTLNGRVVLVESLSWPRTSRRIAVCHLAVTVRYIEVIERSQDGAMPSC